MLGHFVWTFPVYILAADYNLEPNGNFSFAVRTKYVSSGFDGESHLVVFTDADGAERYRAHCNNPDIRAFPLTQEQMLRLLEVIGHSFPKLSVDPNPAVHKSRSTPTADLVDVIRRYLAGELS